MGYKLDARSHILFPKLLNLLRLRNTRYSIFHLPEPRIRTHRARISCFLPCEYPAFFSAMLEPGDLMVKVVAPPEH